MDQRIIQRALTYSQSVSLEGGVLTLHRMVNTREARAFEWLVDPGKAVQWSPVVPAGRIEGTGPVRLGENPQEEAMASEVTAFKAPHRLTLTWGEDELDFTIAGTGLIPAASPSCLLTIAQTLSDPTAAARTATAWHLCVSVLDLRIIGMDVPRVIGDAALGDDFEELREQFAQALGGVPEA